ncbi:MAG: methionine--tRNA ligase [Pseudomonadota bacterium]
MSRHIFIGSAWPYVNGPLHIGHIAGLLPADVLARYHRLVGDEVLWTSGSDCHGTPITERARKEGRTAHDVAKEFHGVVSHTFDQLGFTYSLYWATMEPEHHARVQASFTDLFNQGLIVESDYQHAFCKTCAEGRADREINGSCPICMAEARGDQCDTCGEELNPVELMYPTCTKCGKTVTFEVTRELFFNMPKLENDLRAWVTDQTHWRANAKTWTEGWLNQGLKPRAITRQIDWGIQVPIPGWEDRRIYVWFEAVHGYLTASQQWAINEGNPEAWRPFWSADDRGILAYYVIGKDNIPFHTLMWPGILMAQGLALPWHIVSSEYLVFDDRKLSTSKGWVLWADDMLDRYDPDFIRYFLIASGPEKKDTNFTWERFVEVVNNELVNSYGNLVQRVLVFANKKFDGKVPECGELDERDTEFLARSRDTFEQIGKLIEETELKSAIKTVMELVDEANRYVNDRAPWSEFKKDKARAGTTVAVAMDVIAALSILTEPFMPFQAKRVREMLPFEQEGVLWQQPKITAGTELGEVKILFAKLDEGVIALERARLEEQLKS